MAIEGYTDYKHREYCKDVDCPVQNVLDSQEEGSEEYEEVRMICKSGCVHSTYEFHHWLIKKGYEIVRPKDKN